MTETSYYWEGIATGDATLAPYLETVFHSLWKKLFTQNDNEGVLFGYLNSLSVSGISGGVIVESGAALVNGWFYENDSQLTLAIETPASNPRIDRIVVQLNPGSQIARVAVVQGTEAASPTAPALTQNSGGIWEIPLAQVLVTTGGVITVSSDPEYARTSLQAQPDIELIESITSDGIMTAYDFQNIPQTYKHLKIIGTVRMTNSGVNPWEFFAGSFNEDTGSNYNTQHIRFGNASFIAGSNSLTDGIPFGNLNDSNSAAGLVSPFEILIPNYAEEVFYKTTIQQSILINTNPSQNSLNFDGSIWKNTNAITSIQLYNWNAPGTVLIAGNTASLYGLR
jgi:hypothetical protein